MKRDIITLYSFKIEMAIAQMFVAFVKLFLNLFGLEKAPELK